MLNILLVEDDRAIDVATLNRTSKVEYCKPEASFVACVLTFSCKSIRLSPHKSHCAAFVTVGCAFICPYMQIVAKSTTKLLTESIH